MSWWRKHEATGGMRTLIIMLTMRNVDCRSNTWRSDKVDTQTQIDLFPLSLDKWSYICEGEAKDSTCQKGEGERV